MVIWNGDACDIRPKSGSMIWFQNNKKKNMQEKKSQFFNNSQDYKQINNKKNTCIIVPWNNKNTYSTRQVGIILLLKIL